MSQPENQLKGAKLIDVAGWKMLPCRPDACQECAVKHPEDQPHNQQSLFYQYKFYGANHRWPTWTDAMAHCSDEVKAQWKAALMEHGVKFDEQQPTQPTE